MVRICNRCACVDINKIKELVGEDNVRVGCIGRCGASYMALINREVFEADSEEELLDMIMENHLLI